MVVPKRHELSQLILKSSKKAKSQAFSMEYITKYASITEIFEIVHLPLKTIFSQITPPRFNSLICGRSSNKEAVIWIPSSIEILLRTSNNTIFYILSAIAILADPVTLDTKSRKYLLITAESLFDGLIFSHKTF